MLYTNTNTNTYVIILATISIRITYVIFSMYHIIFLKFSPKMIYGDPTIYFPLITVVAGTPGSASLYYPPIDNGSENLWRVG